MFIFKKEYLTGLFCLVTLVAWGSGCIREIDRRVVNENQIVEMSILFDHGVHEEIMGKMKMNCLSCHPKKAALKDVFPLPADGKIYECHDCHRNQLMLGEATQRCVLCHKDLRPVRPADHHLDWMARHAAFAKLNEFKCATCHDQATCTDCHLQRDTIQQTMHPRIFLHYHSIEARANPQKCGTCHQLDYCRDCHINQGITF